VPAAANLVDGSWTVGSGSEARYGIDDTVFGQTARVIGRTNDVTGTMRIAGATVTAVRVVVNMQSVSCQCVHDAKYRQLMETNKYPTATFELTQAITRVTMPAPGVVISVPVTGEFTIHGVTRTVSFTLEATRIGDRVAVKGSIPVHLADYNIQSPSAGGLGGLSNCTIDLLVAFDRTGP
jgi:polyisoprenoid-binding protein YceI